MLELNLQYLSHLRWRIDSMEKSWCWERLKAGEGDNRGWDDWMASLTQWTWVWVNYGSWWWTWRPGTLRFMVLQRVGYDWVSELNWIYILDANSLICDLLMYFLSILVFLFILCLIKVKILNFDEVQFILFYPFGWCLIHFCYICIHKSIIVYFLLEVLLFLISYLGPWSNFDFFLIYGVQNGLSLFSYEFDFFPHI